MSVYISVDDVVPFKVKGYLKDRSGVDRPFSFFLTCERVSEDVVTHKIRSFDGSLTEFATEFMADVIEEWDDVLDDEKKQVPFSREAWMQLCRAIPGLSSITLSTYRKEASAKEKN